ncbi:hypothetical protein DS2_17362 [Catenovulum agarivorans DS-2]|uniref:Transmembrane protein n=1 Tax=Catenovulum agarivorans DS-2 TaxID=1328313 RepID=W7QK13_9ALTE|nr:transmembrane 220 family protein [Catenovulum agarivorans]EWH08458.1 hypothetical protein DS2_17362 [Catenovulum agarivorans DS-2]
MKWFKLIVGLVFVVFAYLQLNDLTQYGNHDAWIWTSMYLSAAALSCVSAFKKLPQSLITTWAGFCAGALLFRLQDDQGTLHLSRLHPANYWDASGQTMIQNSNESGGLVILLVWAIILVFVARK